ncbi:unnamed protein product [Rangifer tarandus platyrhynchus]|uniref:Uncharacterized protein n=1 Tax=Rangifer tarandus platyrhynchus TaxID=3082113 RepID=A0AC59ZC66_RANTA
MQVTLARRRGEPPAPGAHSQQQRAERKCGALEAPALVRKLQRQPPNRSLPGPAPSSDLRGPGRACIVPFLEFFKSESSLAVNGALFTEAGPAKGRGPAIVRPGCGPLECAGMLARVAQPQSGAFVCKHQQIGPPINNDDLTARAGQASGYQDSIL